MEFDIWQHLYFSEQVARLKSNLEIVKENAFRKPDKDMVELVKKLALEWGLGEAGAVERLESELDRVVVVRLEAAHDKPEEFWTEMAKKIKNFAGKEAVLEIIVDRKLIGGARLAIGGRIFDDTLRTRWDRWQIKMS